MLKEALANRINALVYAKNAPSVHTRDGHLGSVLKTNVLSGTITIKDSSGKEQTLPGRMVADLDSPI